MLRWRRVGSFRDEARRAGWMKPLECKSMFGPKRSTEQFSRQGRACRAPGSCLAQIADRIAESPRHRPLGVLQRDRAPARSPSPGVPSWPTALLRLADCASHAGSGGDDASAGRGATWRSHFASARRSRNPPQKCSVREAARFSAMITPRTFATAEFLTRLKAQLQCPLLIFPAWNAAPWNAAPCRARPNPLRCAHAHTSRSPCDSAVPDAGKRHACPRQSFQRGPSFA
jgi:hypothetical protein